MNFVSIHFYILEQLTWSVTIVVGAYPAINSFTKERDAVRNDSARHVFMGIVIAMVATSTSKDDFWNIMVL